MVEQTAFDLGRRDHKVVGHRAEHTACAGRSEVEDAEDRAVKDACTAERFRFECMPGTGKPPVAAGPAAMICE